MLDTFPISDLKNIGESNMSSACAKRFLLCPIPISNSEYTESLIYRDSRMHSLLNKICRGSNIKEGNTIECLIKHHKQKKSRQ
jgi:hypothetical protein